MPDAGDRPLAIPESRRAPERGADRTAVDRGDSIAKRDIRQVETGTDGFPGANVVVAACPDDRW